MKPVSRTCWILPIIAGCTVSTVALGAGLGERGDLSAGAKRILSAHCAACHGQDNSAEGGFGYVLNVAEMIAQKKITPNSAATSKVYSKIAKELMPPRDEGPNGAKTPVPPVSDADLKLLKSWIDAGAPDFNPAVEKREFAGDEKIFDFIRADLLKLSPGNARNARYFTLTHLYNADASKEELKSYEEGLSKLLNSLSWNARISLPVAIDPMRTIFRIDLRQYDWSNEIWKRIIARYPYGIKKEYSSAIYSYKATGDCLVPYVRGDWFVQAGSEPTLYQAILGIPDTVDELEQKLGVDPAENIRNRTAARAGFNGSGVSENNRVIERHKITRWDGAYWKSYDFGSNDSEKNIFARPLGPGTGPYAFVQDGGELIFNLPNGLQAYMLIDGKGHRIDKGPTTIVHDDKAADRAVANGRSCMSCHVKGMLEKTDEIRARVLNDTTFGNREVFFVKGLYVPAADMAALMTEDRNRFIRALEQAGVDAGKPEPIRALSKRFEAELGLKLAAAETGLTEEDFLEHLKRAPEVSRQLGNLRNGTVKRDLFLKQYGKIVEEFFDLGEFIKPAPVAALAANVNQNGTPTEPVALKPQPVVAPPAVKPAVDANSIEFVNRRENLNYALANQYVGFSVHYPKHWFSDASAQNLGYFLMAKRMENNVLVEDMEVTWVQANFENKNMLSNMLNTRFAQYKYYFPNYRKVGEGPVKFSAMDGYEVKVESTTFLPNGGTVKYFGRGIIVHDAKTGKEAFITLVGSNLDPNIQSADDVGVKGELPAVIDSFKFTE